MSNWNLTYAITALCFEAVLHNSRDLLSLSR